MIVRVALTDGFETKSLVKQFCPIDFHDLKFDWQVALVGSLANVAQNSRAYAKTLVRGEQIHANDSDGISACMNEAAPDSLIGHLDNLMHFRIGFEHSFALSCFVPEADLCFDMRSHALFVEESYALQVAYRAAPC